MKREPVIFATCNKELEEVISKCFTCLTYRNCQPSETSIKLEIPDHPWTSVLLNFVVYKFNIICLLLITTHSLFAAENFKKPQSETVIKSLEYPKS